MCIYDLFPPVPTLMCLQTSKENTLPVYMTTCLEFTWTHACLPLMGRPLCWVLYVHLRKFQKQPGEVGSCPPFQRRENWDLEAISWCPCKFPLRNWEGERQQVALPSVVLSHFPSGSRFPCPSPQTQASVRLSEWSCFRRHLGNLMVIPPPSNLRDLPKYSFHIWYFTCEEFRKIYFPQLFISLLCLTSFSARSSQEDEQMAWSALKD